MCRFLSAIASRSGEVYCNPMLDSHNDIVDYFLLREGENTQWVPVEFIPKNPFEIDSYRFQFDSEKPNWATEKWIEKVTNKLRKIIENITVVDERKILVGSAYIFGPKGKVSKMSGCRVIAVHKEADLSRAKLTGANLSRANLSKANLTGANLSGANLSMANLTGANLSGADLTGANLSGADLSRANLSRAYLSKADLAGANLSGADLSRANLTGANLSGANLSRAYRPEGAEGWILNKEGYLEK